MTVTLSIFQIYCKKINPQISPLFNINLELFSSFFFACSSLFAVLTTKTKYNKDEEEEQAAVAEKLYLSFFFTCIKEGRSPKEKKLQS
jgi:hypothetical protein